MPYLRAILNDGATANDPAALWLALTLCVYAIVNEPGNLFQSDVEALAALVRRLTNSPAWKREFENVFFDVFATKILGSSSYDPFEAIFGMKTIEEVASSKFAECPDYWRKGLGVPMANDASGKYNPLRDDAEDDEPLPKYVLPVFLGIIALVIALVVVLFFAPGLVRSRSGAGSSCAPFSSAAPVESTPAPQPSSSSSVPYSSVEEVPDFILYGVTPYLMEEGEPYSYMTRDL